MNNATQNPGGWPDAARETVEWALAVHFSGNRMPHMSGDPRNRLSPGQRRQMEDARDAVLDALAPILAARVAAARREGIEAAADEAGKLAHGLTPDLNNYEAGYANGALDCERVIRALLGDGR